MNVLWGLNACQRGTIDLKVEFKFDQFSVSCELSDC